MTQKKINRFGHAGKSWNEKEAYKNFLASKFVLDKTEDDPVDINKTSESSFEEEKIDSSQIQKKSKWLKVKDFLYDNWIIAIISSVIFLIVGGYISINREQGMQAIKISSIEKDIEEINKDKKENASSLSLLKEGFGIFKMEVSKDLEFIKKKIKF